MTDESSSSPAPRVRFGRQPFQLVDLPVAEAILCHMSETMPVLFGKMLAEALIGPEAAPRARNRARPA
jgi:hypothetical protein